MQCRGQLDGAIAMGFGWALYEKMVYDANGAMMNPALRDYRIPTFADVPRSEIYFADTYDKVDRWARRRKANAGSIRSRRRLPMRWPTRQACASPIYRSRPTASSRNLQADHERYPFRECLRGHCRHADAG